MPPPMSPTAPLPVLSAEHLHAARRARVLLAHTPDKQQHIELVRSLARRLCPPFDFRRYWFGNEIVGSLSVLGVDVDDARRTLRFIEAADRGMPGLLAGCIGKGLVSDLLEIIDDHSPGGAAYRPRPQRAAVRRPSRSERIAVLRKEKAS